MKKIIVILMLVGVSSSAHGGGRGYGGGYGGYYGGGYGGYGAVGFVSGMVIGNMVNRSYGYSSYGYAQPIVYQQPVVYSQPVVYQQQYQQPVVYSQPQSQPAPQICETRVENINGQMVQGMFCHN